jgi:hypothetical protein
MIACKLQPLRGAKRLTSTRALIHAGLSALARQLLDVIRHFVKIFGPLLDEIDELAHLFDGHLDREICNRVASELPYLIQAFPLAAKFLILDFTLHLEKSEADRNGRRSSQKQLAPTVMVREGHCHMRKSGSKTLSICYSRLIFVSG